MNHLWGWVHDDQEAFESGEAEGWADLKQSIAHLRSVRDGGGRQDAAVALAEVAYDCYRLGQMLGIRMDRATLEVHRSRMSRLGPSGTCVRTPDGRVATGPGFRPPVMPADVFQPMSADVFRPMST